jgi:hypothetical protein
MHLGVREQVVKRKAQLVVPLANLRKLTPRKFGQQVCSHRNVLLLVVQTNSHICFIRKFGVTAWLFTSTVISVLVRKYGQSALSFSHAQSYLFSSEFGVTAWLFTPQSYLFSSGNMGSLKTWHCLVFHTHSHICSRQDLVLLLGCSHAQSYLLGSLKTWHCTAWLFTHTFHSYQFSSMCCCLSTTHFHS